MGDIQSHRDLIVWQKAMDMTFNVYKISKAFPAAETYGLRSQLTRAAASVPANIAEGNARGTSKDYCRFLAIAKGSLAEAETFLLLAIKLEYITEEHALSTLSLMTEIGKMLTTMRSKLSL